jgi:nuclear protein localization protein 4 homolog
MKILIQVASSVKNPPLNALLATGGWQNLLAIAEESTSRHTPYRPVPTESMQDETMASTDFPAVDEGRVCPHCTYVNTHSGNDCEVCGLPLG